MSSELSLAAQFAMLPKEERDKLIESLSPEQLKNLQFDWNWWARPRQLMCFQEDWNTFLYLCGRGWGKGAKLNSLIPTFNGFKLMKDIKVGDKVIDEQGNECTVTGITEPYIPNKAYRITFDDGSNLDVCDEHQFSTWTARDRKQYQRQYKEEYNKSKKFPKDWVLFNAKNVRNTKFSVETMKEVLKLHYEKFSISEISSKIGLVYNTVKKIINGYFNDDVEIFGQIKTTEQIFNTLVKGRRNDLNHCIINTQPINYKVNNKFLNYYHLGLYIGDGISNTGEICGENKDINFYGEYFSSLGYEISIRRRKISFLRVPRLIEEIRYYFEYKINNYSKIFDDSVFRASIEQRLELLQGLMDTDGFVNENGTSCEFTQSNEIIAKQVYQLIISLGMKATITSRFPRNAVTNKIGKESWRIKFCPTMQVFKLPRKANRLNFNGNQFSKRFQRMIVSIEEIPIELMKCIEVDSPSSMYLIGEQMVPTHNSRTSCQWVRKKALDNPGCKIAVVGATSQIVNRTVVNGDGGILDVCLPGEARYKRGDALIEFENGSVAFLYSADEPKRLRGPNHHFALADDIVAWRYPEAYHMLKFTLRIGKNPQMLVTTSAAATPLILNIISEGSEDESFIESTVKEVNSKEIIKKGNLYIVRGTTFENTALPEIVLEDYKKSYPENTVMGQQELLAKIVLKVEGALWDRKWIRYYKTWDMEKKESIPEPNYIKTVIAIDPAVSVNKNSDYTAIVVASKADDGKYYIRYAKRFKHSPGQWTEEVVKRYTQFKCHKIIAEKNNGGDLVEYALRQQNSFKSDGIIYDINPEDLPIELIHAKQGKYLRATPAAMLYENERVIHVGVHSELEQQLLSFKGEPNGSDDLVDALTYTVLDLSGTKLLDTSPPKVGGERIISNLELL